jgi:hypothetical protein
MLVAVGVALVAALVISRVLRPRTDGEVVLAADAYVEYNESLALVSD